MDLSELSDWPEYTKLFVGLLALVPPSVNVPIYLGLTAQRSKEDTQKIAFVSVVGFAVLMIVFVFLGEAILETFGISIAAFRVAGGILLLLIAFDLMRGDPEEEAEEEFEGTISVDRRNSGNAVAIALVPLAVPMLAGPGAISTAVIYAQEEAGFTHRVLVAVVVVLVALFMYVLFRVSALGAKLFTPTVASVFNKVMGLIIAAIAVEFLFHGIADHFPDLRILH
jgi:multiple antibiotic resistance protein